MKSTIGLAISTLNDGIFQIDALCNAGFDEIVIVHQITAFEKIEEYKLVYKKLSAPYIKFISMQETGLSKSRNACIENITTDYLLLCDDDNLLTENIYSTLLQSIEKYPDAITLTGKMLDDKMQPIKNYSNNTFLHSVRTAAKVSSCEMLLKRNWILQNKITFNEQFGLGATYPGGEEFIFLNDIIKAGGTARYIPINICILKTMNTSGRIYTPAMVTAKGAMIRKVYGWQFLFINLAYTMRKYGEYKSSMSAWHFIHYIYFGSINFK
ncbi:MAG: glycosyltransferase [Chitinophagales bacterium]|nr:glycosyltransferase [Bacteroidota bacterium]MBK8488361.1 glycosyltransferase [Bacteroidota bacterium]MBK8681875.1 glycosyltransferase [Bacteroidota bacterium]MBP8754750.1 glycosyltransferase [Chitinophagales bacterium]